MITSAPTRTTQRSPAEAVLPARALPGAPSGAESTQVKRAGRFIDKAINSP